MQERVSGFTVEGDWADIVEHGERITAALRTVDGSDEVFGKWDDWRPKAHEQLDDIRAKTATHARLDRGPGECAGQSPTDDVRNAGDEVIDAYERLDDIDDALEKWRSSVQFLGRAADSTGRRAIRAVEDTVYRQMMTKVSPFYFDNELVSANIQRRHRTNGCKYTFEVNVNDDELKATVRNRLEMLENEVDRWHLDVEKATDTVEAVEGINASDN